MPSRDKIQRWVHEFSCVALNNVLALWIGTQSCLNTLPQFFLFVSSLGCSSSNPRLHVIYVCTIPATETILNVLSIILYTLTCLVSLETFQINTVKIKFLGFEQCLAAQHQSDLAHQQTHLGSFIKLFLCYSLLFFPRHHQQMLSMKQRDFYTQMKGSLTDFRIILALNLHVHLLYIVRLRPGTCTPINY